MIYLTTDIETTEIKFSEGFIVEIGMAALDTDDGAIEIVVDKICREPKMTEEQVKNAWVFQNSSLKLSSVMESKNVLARFGSANEIPIFNEIQEMLLSNHGNTAFNADFDFGWLQSRGFKVPNRIPCLMRFMEGLCKIPNPKKPGTYKHPKFIEALKWAFGEDPNKCPEEVARILRGEGHRAAHDAAADAALLRWVLENEDLSKAYMAEAVKIREQEMRKKFGLRKGF